MQKTVMAAAVLALMGASAANAEETKRFDGFYLGVELGAQHEAGLKSDPWFNANKTNLYYGGVAGYRHQFDGGLVVGLEGMFGDSTYRNAVRPIDCPTCDFLPVVGGDNAWKADYKADYTLGLGATVGTVIGDSRNQLLTLSAGWVKTKNGSVVRLESFAPVKFYDDDGWRVGAGYEWAMTKHLSLRASVDYVSYGAVDLSKFDGFVTRQINGTHQLNGKAAFIVSF